MIYYLFHSDSSYSISLNVIGEEKKNEFYYNICCAKNDVLNSFVRYYQDSSWIFITRSSKKNDKLVIPPSIMTLNFEKMIHVNNVIKRWRKQIKYQLSKIQSLEYQRKKYQKLKCINSIRCSLDYRFIIESLKTTDRIQKQRLKNLQEIYD